MRAILFVIALVCALPALAGPAAPQGLLVLDGRPAPALRLADMDGKELDLAALRGRWALVHFWAS